MLYLLLIFFPISMAASCFVLRKHTSLVNTTAVGVVLVQMFLVLQIPLDEPSRLLGVTLSVNELTQLFMLLFLGVGMLSFLVSLHLPHGENFVPVTLLILMLACTILMLQDPFLVSLLLVGAGITAVLAIVDLPPSAGVLVDRRVIAIAIKYLLLMVVAGVLMYLSFVLADIYRPGEVPGRIPLARFILALLVGGFALRLALIPFHTWLPNLVEHASPLVSALIVAIINTTSLLVLVLSFQRFPVLLVENPSGIILLRIGGIVTCVLAGLMSLGQLTMRRSLAMILIYNSGMMFYGLASVSLLGLTGAIFEAFNQTLAVVLIFVSLGLLERPDGRAPGVVRRDLLHRWPVASVGFLGGGMALLGLPPLNGFASKMLLYQAALEHGWLELVLLLLSTACAGMALVRLAYRRFLGPAEEVPTPPPLLHGETELDRPPERRLAPEPRSTAILTMTLLSVCLVIGLYPQPFLTTISEVIRGLTFVSL
jgi:formate hydrogenlyase subunit 3/multisubunit Na+/H+ antiporter MnhD subunit